MLGSPVPGGGVLARLRSESWFTEAQRKAIHLGFLVLPLELLHEWLPWPRGRSEWRLVLIALVSVAIALDVVRLHEPRVRRFFRTFFGEMVREHEQLSLLGSTYLLMATLLAVEIFARPVAAGAIGFTVLGDGFAAIIGKAYGRTRFFHKTLEGAAGGLVACLAWASYLSPTGQLPWGVSLAGAMAASLVELLPIPLDDNLGMTLFAGYTMKLLGNGG
jgi:glycerol-3-phosphate acyltransferase PlsY